MADLEAGLAGDTLSRCRLFRDLGAEVIGEITSSSNERFCDPGEEVFQEGHDAESVFVVDEGRVGLMLTLPNGHEIKILAVAPEEAFGWSSLAAPHRYLATARCLRESAVVEVPAAALVEIAGQRPEVGVHLMQQAMALSVAWIADLRMQLTAALD